VSAVVRPTNAKLAEGSFSVKRKTQLDSYRPSVGSSFLKAKLHKATATKPSFTFKNRGKSIFIFQLNFASQRTENTKIEEMKPSVNLSIWNVF